MYFLLYLRELFISNFGIKIYGIQFKNKEILYINNKFSYIFYFFPFSLFRFLNNNTFIYFKDNIYFITNILNNRINPIIIDFIFSINNNHQKNMNTAIKFYNSSIPLKFFIIHNELEKYNLLTIRFMSKGQINEKILDIRSNYDKLIYELFL